MLRIAICDDNLDFQQNVVKLIKKWSEQSDISVNILTFDNGDGLIDENSSAHLDIIFLDILMPMLNGMETAKELRQTDKAVKIIFLTSSPEFALESYDVKAWNYLLKPVAYERLKEVLDECASTFEMEPEHLVVKTSSGYQKMYFHNIEYIEAQNKRVVFYLRTKTEVEVNEKLSYFDDKFSNNSSFFRCHRSYLVYLPNVDHFNRSSIITKSGMNIPIARGCAKAFKEAYFARMFQE